MDGTTPAAIPRRVAKTIAVTAVAGVRSKRIVPVALPASFASYWLIPRLPGFYQKHPEIDLHLDSLGYFKLMEGEGVDVVLHKISKWKCENQDNYLPFLKGEFVFFADATSDARVEDGIKLIHSLMEFRKDPNMNYMPDKNKSAGKIDPVVSGIIAIGVSQTGESDDYAGPLTY